MCFSEIAFSASVVHIYRILLEGFTVLGSTRKFFIALKE